MSSVFCFQTQLASIMDALSKAAVTEIGKLVEIESKMLKIEISRGRNEIAALSEKLQLMEKLLFLAQGGRRGAALRGAGPGRDCREPAPAPEPEPEPEQEASRVSVKSETLWDTSCSFTQKSEQLQAEMVPVPPLQPENPENHPELMAVKEEPVAAGGEEQRRDVQQSPDVLQQLQPTSDRHTFPECFVTLSEPSLGWSDAPWSPPLPPINSSPEGGRSLAHGSASSLRSSKVHGLRSAAAKHFGCPQCGKSFRCFSQLEIHQRSHTGEKPFRCTLCGKRYAQKGHLYTHQRTHTGEKPYRCPVCGKGFIQKCTLDMHKRTHTGEKPFVCTKCGKGFTKKCNLKKHLHVHLDAGLHAFDSSAAAAAFTPTLVNGAR